MILCYITDRHQFPGAESQRCARLLVKIAEAARAGVDYIQLREKDLAARDLECLASDALAAVRGNSKQNGRQSRLLVNHRIDVALAVGADGVHLRSDDIPAGDARALLSKNKRFVTRKWTIGVSCHTRAEIALAEAHGADFAVFAPVFGKLGSQGIGLPALRDACTRTPNSLPKVEAGIVHHIPVLALGGVTLGNAADCLQAGAAGIAGIRLFQENGVEETVSKLRTLVDALGHERL